MADYKSDSERFLDLQEQLERDRKYAENRKALSDCLAVPTDKVMDVIRSPTHRLRRRIGPNGEIGPVISDSYVFKGAPDGLTDPELAEWQFGRFRSVNHAS